MTDLKEIPMANTRERRDDELRQTIKTLPATENAFRALARELGVKLDRTPQHDEVLFAMVILSNIHTDELADLIRSRRA